MLRETRESGWGVKSLAVKGGHMPGSSGHGMKGIVGFCIERGMGAWTKPDAPDLPEVVRAGLAFAELDELQRHLGVPREKLAVMLGISNATLHRRMASGKLDAAESDRVVRYARLLGAAANVMESVENGRRWLASPQFGLGGAIPLHYAETEVGAREVEALLGRIEHGVYA